MSFFTRLPPTMLEQVLRPSQQPGTVSATSLIQTRVRRITKVVAANPRMTPEQVAWNHRIDTQKKAKRNG